MQTCSLRGGGAAGEGGPERSLSAFCAGPYDKVIVYPTGGHQTGTHPWPTPARLWLLAWGHPSPRGLGHGKDWRGRRLDGMAGGSALSGFPPLP